MGSSVILNGRWLITILCRNLLILTKESGFHNIQFCRVGILPAPGQPRRLSQRSVEQSNLHPHRSLLNGDQVHRIYLNELGEAQALPISVAAVVLTIVNEAEAPETARDLLTRTEQAAFTAEEKQNIIDIVTSIMMYKFATLSQLEVREMLGLNLSEEPRAIREAKAEGREEGKEEEAIALVNRLLQRRLQQDLPDEVRARLSALSLVELEDLSEALLDFTSLADLEVWLANRK
jgi:predicted transposase YdaD